ncbi:hypothetical protein D3C85_1536190 [compost metagenome]
MVITVVWREAVPANLSCPPSANFLLDSMQKLFRMRGKDHLFTIKETALKERAPDAVSVLIIYSDSYSNTGRSKLVFTMSVTERHQ